MEKNLPDELIEQVWRKAEPVCQLDPACVRLDGYGAWIYRHAYGDRGSAYGWEVDFIVPPRASRHCELDNLRPMQWQNVAMRQSGRLDRAVSAMGLGNNLPSVD